MGKEARMSRKLLDLPCTLVRETDKAVLVSTDANDEVWVPKSLCEVTKDDPDEDPPCKATITIKQHWAIEKELI
jgi:hypothetical protein